MSFEVFNKTPVSLEAPSGDGVPLEIVARELGRCSFFCPRFLWPSRRFHTLRMPPGNATIVFVTSLPRDSYRSFLGAGERRLLIVFPIDRTIFAAISFLQPTTCTPGAFELGWIVSQMSRGGCAGMETELHTRRRLLPSTKSSHATNIPYERYRTGARL